MKIDHNNNFDLIRLFAALQVVQMHSASVIGLPGRPAWLVFALEQLPGVTIFFIVSGFLVTWSYLYGAGGIPAYFIRRSLRIYPALWVNVALILMLLAATGSLSPDLSVTRLIEWIAVTFVVGSDVYGTHLVGSIVSGDGFYKAFPTGVLWTIPIELTFYALLPLILPGRTRFLRYAWLFICGWAIASLCVLATYAISVKTNPSAVLTKVLSINPFTDLWIFLIGAAIAVYWERLKTIFEGNFIYWFSAYMALAIVERFLFGVGELNMHTPTPLMFLKMIVLACAVISFAYTWRGLAAVLRGVDVSYGIYLYHLPLVVTLGMLGFKETAYLWPVVFAGTGLLAAASWFAIERPALRLRSRSGTMLIGRRDMRVEAKI